MVEGRNTICKLEAKRQRTDEVPGPTCEQLCTSTNHTLVLVLNLVVSAVQDGKLRAQMFIAIESILCHSIRLPENDNQASHHHEANCHCGK